MIENLLSPGHLLLLGIVALLVIGPKRLPEVGRGIGKALREFKHATSEMTDELRTEINEKPNA
jgi:sec-independent protein translocase protein TatA